MLSERFGGNDISMIIKAHNSTFFANTSRHTLCPGDANFTLHEEPLLQVCAGYLDSFPFAQHLLAPPPCRPSVFLFLRSTLPCFPLSQ